MPLTLRPILSTMPSSSIGRNDLVDRLADPIGEPGGLLDPRAGLRPHMHLDLPAIDAREEVLAEVRGKREREQGEADEPGDQLAAVVQAEVQQAAIGAADRLEAALEALLEPHQRIAAGDAWTGRLLDGRRAPRPCVRSR